MVTTSARRSYGSPKMRTICSRSARRTAQSVRCLPADDEHHVFRVFEYCCVKWCRIRPVSAMPEAEMIIIGSCWSLRAFDCSRPNRYRSTGENSKPGGVRCARIPGSRRRKYPAYFMNILEVSTASGESTNTGIAGTSRVGHHLIEVIDQFLRAANRKGRDDYLAAPLNRPADCVA